MTSQGELVTHEELDDLLWSPERAVVVEGGWKAWVKPELT